MFPKISNKSAIQKLNYLFSLKHKSDCSQRSDLTENPEKNKYDNTSMELKKESLSVSTTLILQSHDKSIKNEGISSALNTKALRSDSEMKLTRKKHENSQMTNINSYNKIDNNVALMEKRGQVFLNNICIFGCQTNYFNQNQSFSSFSSAQQDLNNLLLRLGLDNLQREECHMLFEERRDIELESFINGDNFPEQEKEELQRTIRKRNIIEALIQQLRKLNRWFQTSRKTEASILNKIKGGNMEVIMKLSTIPRRKLLEMVSIDTIMSIQRSTILNIVLKLTPIHQDHEIKEIIAYYVEDLASEKRLIQLQQSVNTLNEGIQRKALNLIDEFKTYQVQDKNRVIQQLDEYYISQRYIFINKYKQNWNNLKSFAQLKQQIQTKYQRTKDEIKRNLSQIEQNKNLIKMKNELEQTDVSIELTLLDINIKNNFIVKGTTKIADLKHLVYSGYSQQYEVEQFFLTVNGQEVDEEVQLFQFCSKRYRNVKIVQCKNILKNAKIINHRFVNGAIKAELDCRHLFDREEMIAIMEEQCEISDCILCPECELQWNIETCRFVAGYGRTQMKKKVLDKLGRNYMIEAILPDLRSTRIKCKKGTTFSTLKLKELAHIYEDLLPEQTVLVYNGQIMRDEDIIDIKIKVSGRPIQLIQRKAELHEIATLRTDPSKTDPITQEEGVAILSCGHQVGRSALKDYIEHRMKSGEIDMVCPHKQKNGVDNCPYILDKKEWLLISGFTQKEVRQIEEAQTAIWKKNNSKDCPNCKSTFSTLGTTTKKVKCSKCNYGYFCLDCLGLWQVGNTKKCGNQACMTFFAYYIARAPHDKKFLLNTIVDGHKKLVEVMVPSTRVCPKCRANPIQHTQGCKHMQCPCSGKEKIFCFVCLQLKQNGKWPCGDTFDYCKIAPNQIL